MKGSVYLFRKCKFDPVSSAEVEIPDDADDDRAVLIAAHALMKDFRVELYLEDKDETIRRRIPSPVKKTAPPQRSKTSQTTSREKRS